MEKIYKDKKYMLFVCYNEPIKLIEFFKSEGYDVTVVSQHTPNPFRPLIVELA